LAVITNYATLQTAIADYLARDDLTSWLPNFIENTERKLYRTLNLRNEETALSVSISSGTATVPTDFKALKFAYYASSPTTLLQWMPVEDLYRKYPTRSGSNTPCAISREGSSFIFGPYPADGTLNGIYYAKQDLLQDTDPSWYASNAPEVLLYGSLVEAGQFIQDDAVIARFAPLFNDAVSTLLEEEKESAVSKGSLVQRVGVGYVA